MNDRLSRHATEEMQRRAIPPDMVDAVLQGPQQIVTQPNGIKVYQSRLDFRQGKLYLARVFVNDTVDPSMVVTVYRTSNIGKYGSQP